MDTTTPNTNPLSAPALKILRDLSKRKDQLLSEAKDSAKKYFASNQ